MSELPTTDRGYLVHPCPQCGHITPHVGEGCQATMGRPCGCRGPGGRAPAAGFWEQLGVDEALMPVHLPMPLTADGQGPAEGDDIAYWGCWTCGTECPLGRALAEASGK